MGVSGLKERGYKMSPETHLLAGGPTDLMTLPPHFLLPSSLTRILCLVGTHFCSRKQGQTHHSQFHKTHQAYLV